MNPGISAEQRQQVIEALDTPLAKALVAMVEAVRSLNLDPKSNAALANASATLPDAPIPTALAELKR